MVVLYLKNSLQLDDESTHLKTKFELSDTMNFSNIIATSNSDKNKYAVLFNVDLDPAVKYYARAQALLSTGWTTHANLDIVDVRMSGLTGYKNGVLPSKIATPILSTDSLQAKHGITNFTINANGFERVGTSVHNTTIYYITDIDNNILWYRISNVELNSITVNDLILEENQSYKVNVIFGSSSNDFSQKASLSIVTGGNDNLFLLNNKNVLPGENYDVHYMQMDGLTTIDIELYEFSDISKLVHTETISGNRTTLPYNLFNNKLYILKAKSNLDDCFKNEILQVS